MFASFEPFIAYWHELRGNEILPSREAFHPAKVISFMGRIAIVERHDSTHFTSRLVGTEIVSRLGHEHTGEDFLTLMDSPEARSKQLILYNSVLDQPCGVCGAHDMITNHGTYHAQFLILPIRHKASHAGEFFAVFDFDSSLFDVAGVTFEHFGELRGETMLDLGAGVPARLAHLPVEQLHP